MKTQAPHGALEDQNQFFALKAIPAKLRTPNQDARLAFLRRVISTSPSRLALLAETMGAPIKPEVLIHGRTQAHWDFLAKHAL